ncbi:MAG: cytochrome c biogenesis protein CcdA [Minisyncoccia bacterium]
MLSLIIPSFIAGLITFLAPCTLPLVPAYLTFIGGASVKDLGDKDKVGKARVKVFLNGLFFVLGFSFVFISLGLFAGTIGGFVSSGRIWFSRIGGLAVILFGLVMLEVINIPSLTSEKKFQINPNSARRGTYGFSFFLGVVFGSGWTPCIGPILGSVLVIAGSSATAGSGAILLAAFSLGLAIPFLLIALGIGRAQKLIDRHADKLGFVTKIGGVLIIILGVFLLVDKMYLLASYGYKILEFFNYDSLMNYL